MCMLPRFGPSGSFLGWPKESGGQRGCDWRYQSGFQMFSDPFLLAMDFRRAWYWTLRFSCKAWPRHLVPASQMALPLGVGPPDFKEHQLEHTEKTAIYKKMFSESHVFSWVFYINIITCPSNRF